MNPIIFSKNETSFTSNGLGRLFPVSCKVKEERNGKYEAEIEITEKEKHYNDIELGSLIGLKVSDGTLQAFRIYTIEKSLDETIVLKAAHISYDLSYIPVPAFSASNITEALNKIKTQALVYNPFNFTTDITSAVGYEMKKPLSARAYLGGTEGSILDKYHGEYKFDNYNVTLYQSRGANNGVTIRYGKNLVKLDNEDTCENTIDGLVPYWTDGTFNVVGSILRVNNGNKIIVEDVTDSITLPEGVERPTAAQVETAGRHHLAQKVTGNETKLKVEWYEDKTISEVQLCDTVNVIYEPYNINVEMKVTETVWDVIEEHYDEIELGEYKSFAKTISEMSSDISSLKYNDGQTSIRLERTESGLEAEVERALDAEDGLSELIEITAEGVKSTAAANVKEYYEGNLNIDYYGYGAPSNTQYPPSSNNGKKYLDRTTGYYYTCNGTTWVRSAQPLQEMTDLMSSEISQSAREVKASVSSAIQQWDTTGYYISAYGIGYPTEADFPPAQYTNAYYLDQQSGTIYRSNGSTWSYWTYCELITTDIYGELAVKIDEDDDGTIISLINGSANHINFVADNMFTVSAPNFSVDRNGNIEATNATLEGQTNFADIGYVGSTTVGDDTGIGLRNNAGTGAVVIGPTQGNLWLKGANVVCYLGSYGFLPWTSSVNLGSQTKKWSTLYCDDISCSSPPWSSSDKRMKDIHGTIDKVRDFYMALEPLKYTFKKGVDYENPDEMQYGLIAQDVLKTYKKCYNTDKQGIVQKRKILESGTKEVVGDTEKYVINYDELHAFHIAMIQELRAEVDALKAEIKALKKGAKE